ncbi:hypothetical protein Golomagni_05311 [Golovinomyces magnicellulatus]|nr:hypothetical protein Golomagni_05311 [Golovinomyces magnicellulatus]
MLSPDTHQLVVLQEPSINKTTLGTYCPKGYNLCMEPALETRVAFLVSKKISESLWSYRWYSALVAQVTLRLDSFTISVFNVYSLITSGPEITGWDTISELMLNNEQSYLLLGDFNCHHPYWGGISAPRDTRAQALLNSTTSNGLHLITTPGIPTFRRRGREGVIQETVIDLSFATEDIRERVISCTTREDWSLRQDHIPIEIKLDLTMVPRTEKLRYAFQKVDPDKLKKTIRQSNWNFSQEPLVALQEELVKGLLLHCPRSRPSPQARAEWSPCVSRLVKDTR